MLKHDIRHHAKGNYRNDVFNSVHFKENAMQKPPIFRKQEDKGIALEQEITWTLSLRHPFSVATFLKHSNSVVPEESLLPSNLRGLICLV